MALIILFPYSIILSKHDIIFCGAVVRSTVKTLLVYRPGLLAPGSGRSLEFLTINHCHTYKNIFQPTTFVVEVLNLIIKKTYYIIIYKFIKGNWLFILKTIL